MQVETVDEADALWAEIARMARFAEQIRKDVAALQELLAPIVRDAADDTAAAQANIEDAIAKIDAQIHVLDAMASDLAYEREGGDRQHSTHYREAL
jgi:hypothetical protein